MNSIPYPANIYAPPIKFVRRWSIIAIIPVLCLLDILGYVKNYNVIVDYCDNCTGFLCCLGYDKRIFYNMSITASFLNAIPIASSLVPYKVWKIARIINVVVLVICCIINFIIFLNGITSYGFLGMIAGFAAYCCVFGAYTQEYQNQVNSNEVLFIPNANQAPSQVIAQPPVPEISADGYEPPNKIKS